MKKYLWLMVGPPGSGKSTAAKKMFQKDALYISRDEIRFALLQNDEPYFAHEDEVVENFYRQIQQGLNNGKVVVADATHLTEKARSATINSIKLAEDDELMVNAVVACTPLEVSLERNAKRNGLARVPESAIKNMYHSCTDPQFDKNITYSWIIYINENQEIIETAQPHKEEK